MGANTFEVTALGKDANEAFRTAVDQAAFEYGHDPYSGTIATKAGSGLVNLDQILKPFSAKRRDVIASAALGTWKADQVFTLPGEKNTWSRKHSYRGITFEVPKDLKPTERDAACQISLGVDDKWGPCGYYEVTGSLAVELKRRMNAPRGSRVYRFLGWAAS